MKETLHKAHSSENGLMQNHTENKFYVYALVCPIENMVKYVGATKNPDLRYKNHLKTSVNKRKGDWIKSLNEKGKTPVMKILFSTNSITDCADKERFYINSYRLTILNSNSNFSYKAKRSKFKKISAKDTSVKTFLMTATENGFKLSIIAELMYPNNKGALSYLSNKLNETSGRKFTTADSIKAIVALNKIRDEIYSLTIL